MRPENRRPNSYYLGSTESPTFDSFSVWLKSSRSGDVVSPPCSPQVGSAPRPPSLYGRRLCCTVPAVVPARPARIFAPCPYICGREYFHLFPGKNQKPNAAHKCCVAKAIFYCPSMNSHRPRSQDTAKERTLIPEKDSKRKRPRSHVSLEKSSKNYKLLEK